MVGVNMIRSVNLALSNRCTASCIFCPSTRGKRVPFDMPLSLVKKIVDEAASPAFPWKVDAFQVGENGDALLNMNFLEILRYIKAKMPTAKVYLSTNFASWTPQISEAVLKEGLISNITVNLDGHDSASYEAEKHLPLTKVLRNLLGFLTLRRQLDINIPLQVLVLPLTHYVELVLRRFGNPPGKLTSSTSVPESSFGQVVAAFKPLLGEDVPFHVAIPMGWAERDHVDPDEDQSMFPCRNLGRIETEAFISPNGDWYACCYDDQQLITFGNLNEKTLLEVHDSDKRLELIQKLKAHRYRDIGYPCSTVKACQAMSAIADPNRRDLKWFLRCLYRKFLQHYPTTRLAYSSRAINFLGGSY